MWMQSAWPLVGLCRALGGAVASILEDKKSRGWHWEQRVPRATWTMPLERRPTWETTTKSCHSTRQRQTLRRQTRTNNQRARLTRGRDSHGGRDDRRWHQKTSWTCANFATSRQLFPSPPTEGAEPYRTSSGERVHKTERLCPYTRFSRVSPTLIDAYQGASKAAFCTLVGETYTHTTTWRPFVWICSTGLSAACVPYFLGCGHHRSAKIRLSTPMGPWHSARGYEGKKVTPTILSLSRLDPLI